MIDKCNGSITPSKQQLKEYVSESKLLNEFCDYVESNYNPKERIDYSKCTAIPGWNLKYLLKGKTICTIYPYPTHFTTLITLNADNALKFEMLKVEFSGATQQKVQDAKPLNGTKWIILDITDEITLSDAINLIALKYE